MSEVEIEAPAESVAEAPKKERQSNIAVAAGQFAPKDHTELIRVIDNIAAGGGFPERLKTREMRIAAYNLSHSLMGSRWQLCLNNIAVIKGQMTIYGELPSALAEQTKEVQEKRVFCIDKDFNEICVRNKNIASEPWAGVCEIQRKGRAKKEFTYTIDEARKAGQYPPTKWDKELRKSVPNEDSPWMKFTKVMLMRKAMALAVKFEFADAMVGVPVAEYDFDSAPDIKDVTPVVDRAAELNARFSSTGGSNEQCNTLRSSGETDSELRTETEGGAAT